MKNPFLAAAVSPLYSSGEPLPERRPTKRHYHRGPSEKMRKRYKTQAEHNRRVEDNKRKRHEMRIERDRLGLDSIDQLPGYNSDWRSA